MALQVSQKFWQIFMHKGWDSLADFSSILLSHFGTLIASNSATQAKSSEISNFTQAFPFFQVLTPFQNLLVFNLPQRLQIISF